jgi:hypothetical protein
MKDNINFISVVSDFVISLLAPESIIKSSASQVHQHF